MKIKKLAITILMITFYIILGTKAYATTGTINSNTVDLKKQPDSKIVLDYLNKQDEVEILEHNNGWYKVKAQTEQGKVTGYVSERYIDVETSSNTEAPQEASQETPTEEPKNNEAPTENSAETSVINVEENQKYTLNKEINVKILPLINSREKSKINGNITVLEIINDWAKIENDIQSGWVRKNILKNAISNTENATQEKQEEPSTNANESTVEEPQNDIPATKQEETTTELNKTGYVSADGLRVRKEPTTDSEEIDSLSRNHKVNIIGQTGKWYKIDLDGKTGYVSAKYISDTKLPEVTSRSGSTLKNSIEIQETAKQENVENTPVETTSETTTSEQKTTGAEIVEFAKKYLGYKYVSGGASPSKGFDCSGFTSYVYKNFGISLARTSSAQNKNGVAVKKEDLQLGDIVIFNNDANTSIGHVGIYIGDGNFIHASNPSDGVKITALTTGYYQKRYVGARRVI